MKRRLLSLGLCLCLLMGLALPVHAAEVYDPPGEETLTERGTPEVPETSEDPEASAEPETPVDPETPADQETTEDTEPPMAPETPVDQENPEDPETPANSENPGPDEAEVSLLDNLTLSGAGTEADPYRIYTQDDLLAVSNHLTAYFSLMNDIVLTVTSWTPIGQSTAFSGTFDGNGHTISGLNIPDNENECNGLFGQNNGRIRNLKVDGTIKGKTYTGVLAGVNNGTIFNCFSSGSAYSPWGNSSYYSVGGLVGKNNSGKSITASGSSATASGWKAYIGGLTGKNEGTITNCYAWGDASSSESSYGAVGGLTGSNSGTLRNCYAAGKANDGAGGGLSGTTGGRVYNCYFRVANTGNRFGFSVSTGDLSTQSTFYFWDFDYVWTMDVETGYPKIDLRGAETDLAVFDGTGTSDSPYLVQTEAQLYAMSMDLAVNKSAVCYRLANDITITAKLWTPIGVYETFKGTFDGNGHAISGVNVPEMENELSGLFGQNDGRIRNLKVDGKVTGKTYTGVLAGVNNGTISNCFSSGSVYSRWGNSSYYSVGGLVGKNNSGKSITASGSSATASGWKAYIGGLTGKNEGTITNCYAWGDASSSESSYGAVGGLTGSNSGTLRNCYAAGKANDGAGGGLSGTTGGRVYNCYFRAANTGNRFGFSVSTGDLSTQSTFYFWDFDHVWTMDAETGYPKIDLRGTETNLAVFQGDGIADDPYLVRTEAQLYAMSMDLATNKSTVCYQLVNDITITAKFWMPIGVYESFQGTFDGNGHTISGVNVPEMENELSGLFGQNDGRIRNLKVDGKVTGKTYTGVLAGVNNGTISNCFSSGSAYSRWGNSSYYSVGGLVGKNNSGKSITASGSSATASGWKAYIGGLTGKNEGTITNCYAWGDASSSESSYGAVGGLTGSNSGTLRNCYATGKANGGAGGSLSGTTSGRVYNCYGLASNTANLYGYRVSQEDLKAQGTFYFWDFDHVWAMDAETGYPKIDLRGTETNLAVFQGDGIADDPYLVRTEAQLYAMSMDLATNKSTVCYQLVNDIIITAKFWTPIGVYETFKGTFDGNGHTISGVNVPEMENELSGLFGQNDGRIRNLKVDGKVTGKTYTGVLAGVNNGTISNCFSSGSAYSRWGNNSYYSVGGLVGKNNSGKSITASGSSATASGWKAYIGGLTGKNEGTITNCYARGNASTSESSYGAVGGFTGSNSGTLSNCYSTGIVSSSGSNTGGLVGTGSGTVTSCYYDSSTSGQLDTKGTPTSTENMKLQTTYAGWDFSSIWSIDGNINNGYPYLQAVVPVEQTPVTGVTMNKNSLTLEAGKSETLTATVQPANATNKAVTWSSSNTAVATVSNGMVTAKAAGTATITVTTADGNKTATCTVTVTGPATTPVTGVTLNKNSLTLEAGKSETLTATVQPANATNKAVTWSSSNTAVATVSNGTVTAKAAGTATITVTTADGNKTAACTVTVTDPGPAIIHVTGVSLNATALTLEESASAVLTASILPGNATEKGVSWISSDPNLVQITGNGASCEVTALPLPSGVSAKSTTVTVITTDGRFTASCVVTVNKKADNTVKVTGVTLDQSTMDLTVGGGLGGNTGVLSAKVTPGNASNKNVTWTSSDPAVATVTDGKVFALKAGTTVITVTTVDGSKTAQCTVKVTEEVSQITRLSLNKTELNLHAGESEALKAVFEPSNVTEKVTWSSSDPTVAEVTQDGVVTAKRGGTATISVATGTIARPDGSASIFVATCTVKVARTMTGIAVTTKPDKLAYAYGENLDTTGMTVSTLYDDGTSQAVTGWRTSGYDPNRSGTQTVTVTYQSYTAVFTVTVAEKGATSTLTRPQISIKSVPGGKDVTLTAPEGTSIYYTLTPVTQDQAAAPVPTISDHKYSGPIHIEKTSILKAIAIQNNNQSVKSGITTVQISVPKVGAPAPFPGGNQGSGNRMKDGTLVTLRSDTTGSAIYYTLDGTTPDPDDKTHTMLYSGAVALYSSDADENGSLTLNAIAVKDGYSNSAVTSTDYVMEKIQRPQNEVTISLGSVSTKAGAVASVPLYLISDKDIAGFQITMLYDKDAFENYVTVTPAEGIDRSKLFLSSDNGLLTLLYAGDKLISSGEVCTLNFTSLVSKANTSYPVTVAPEATTVSCGEDIDVQLSAMNGLIELGEALQLNLNTSVTYTKKDGTAATMTDINSGTAEIETSVTIDNPAADAGPSQGAASGSTAAFGNLYLVIYDRDRQMVSVKTWRVDLSEPTFMFLQTIEIPKDVKVGAIKIMLLSDQMVPLMAASELAK